MSVIKIENITKDYGSSKGVFDVSFAVEKGEILGFLGPNGAGKTTTIRQLMGFIKPDSGKVSINGMDCFEDASEIEKNLGYLPGEIAFMDDMKGLEFIKFIAGMKGMKGTGRADELMKRFELDASGKIKKMSKGMKQKIGIVCAFMQDSDILILDEPTSGLDPLMQNLFIELIIEEKQRGKSILMSSHIFEEIERTCDRAAIIRDGRIVDVKNMDKLRANKSKIFEIKFANIEDALSFSKAYPKAKRDKCSVIVEISGDTDSLIKALSRFAVRDINIHSQTLEELFMKFYAGGQTK